MTQTPTKEIKAGRMMLLYLSEAAKAARERAERRVEGVADLADVSVGAVYRFERGESWPHKVDQVVSAYADIAGVEPLEIWQRALNLWRKYGEGPLVGRRDTAQPTTGSARFLDQIAKTARRQAAVEAPAAPSRMPTSTPKRRAAG